VIIILEGLNATGKSTLASQLSGELGYPVIRMFRRSTDDHLDGGLVQYVRQSFGIPANTYIEDAFVAETLVLTKASAILDRSMPSGTAYGILENRIDLVHIQQLMEFWCDILCRVQTQVIFAHSDRVERARRARQMGRRLHSQDHVLESLLNSAMNHCTLPIVSIDTTQQPVDVVFRSAMKHIL
jgi:thymidylate kinase